MTDLSVAAPRCEYHTNPLGLDTPQPRLSWELRSDQRGTRQAAYQVVVATDVADLGSQQPPLWDSGRIVGDQSAQVAYDGPALRSGQRVYWQVTVWDERGRHATSAPAWWEMGLLDSADWRAAWIGAAFLGGPRTTSPAPYLRTTFDVAQPIIAARLYVTALGLVEPWLNGAPVGEDLFVPGWTDYHQRVQYHTYDVTAQLRQGPNVLGAILGDGWYCGFIGMNGRQQYGDRPRLLAQLELRLVDGSRQWVVSGPGWRVAVGPILESDFQMGESYDARRELGDWAAPAYDAVGWSAAEQVPAPSIALSAPIGPPVRRQAELHTMSITQLPGHPVPRWIFDLGQNMVGHVRLSVRGARGLTLTLRYAEVLNPDGTLYTANLRDARATDHYTLMGEGEELWAPRFSFHGFRYVELSNYPGTPTTATLTGVVIYSAMTATGSFSCSNQLINQLQQNIVWGQRGNFVALPTDCPQRDERLGWTGDAQVFMPTAAFNMDVASFFTRWLRDLADAQGEDGRLPAIVPLVAHLPSDGGPAWADAGVICPWTLYQLYGDTRILATHYGLMCRFVAFLATTSHEGIRCYQEYDGWQGFGDWLALDGSADSRGRTPKALLGTAFFAHSAHLLAQIAQVLDKPADAAHYLTLFETVRDAFVREFVTPDGRIVGETQTAYVLALHFDLLPLELRPAALAALVHDIAQRDTHVATGFVGTPYLPWVLGAHGRMDVAYALLMQTTCPSWLYSVTQGATTIWERWDGWTHDQGFQDPWMNSFNHYAYGAIGAWLYAVVAGINADRQRPGYKQIALRPRPGGGLTHATAELHTMSGLVRSAWRLEHGQFTWTIAVPPNSSATIFVPLLGGAHVCEGETDAADAPGVRLLRREAEVLVYAIESGAYHFRVVAAPGEA